MLNAFLLPLFGFSVYGYWADFIPSQKWADAAMYISSSLTFISCGAFYWLILTGKYQLQVNVSRAKKALYSLVFPIVVFFVFWISLTHGISDIATIISGNRRTDSVVLEKKFTLSRGCKYRLIGDYMENAYPAYLCVNAKAFESLPQKAVYRLQISEAFFGTHVARFELAER